MRNLQKILALALALIMSFSLVVTANAFDDDADITETYSESVNVLAALNVFKGYTDGTYQPQKSITRAEVAAIIYRIATGDVTDDQVAIYSDWNRFTDVHSGEWWAGYINYCANAEYIKGYGNGKFGPDDPVTGYEALAMILRAVGYGQREGEFQGSDWAVQTAARANSLKVTKNVQNTALLNSAATRELVAELLFRSILVPTVTYNQFSDYTENDETLAYRSFGLEMVEGVVIANEYANLQDTQVLDADKTQLQEADGTIRSLEIGSELTDVGEAQYAYIIDSTRGAKVLGLERAEANNTWEPENGKGTSVKDALKAAGMKEGDSTEFYVNFGREGHFYCEQRLEFTVVFYNKADAEASFDKAYEDVSKYAHKQNLDDDVNNDWSVWTNYVDPDNHDDNVKASKDAANYDFKYVAPADETATNKSQYPVAYNRVIRAGEEITNEEMDIIRGIFAAADNEDNNGLGKDAITGDVYVGTKSTKNQTDEERDVSNSISYKKFVDEYISSEAWDEDMRDSGNGEWLKLVDYDNDGTADYVFLTEYWLDKAVSSYTKSGETILEFNSMDVESIEDNDGIIDIAEDVEVGTVVYYTKIDNRWTVTKAPVVNATIQTVNFKDDSCTTTDGETYTESDIFNESRLDQEVENLQDKVEYNLYFDAYGWLRAYELANGNTYGLITELYKTNTQNVQYVKGVDLTVELKKGSDKIAEFDVENSDGNVFLLSVLDKDSGAAINNWSELNADLGYSYFTNNSKIELQPAIGQLGKEWANESMLDTRIFSHKEKATTGTSYATTNVAVYTETTDGEVRLTSPVQLAKSVKGEQLYYVNPDLSGAKTADVKEIMKADGKTQETDKAEIAKRTAYTVDYIGLDLSAGVKADAKHYPISKTASRYANQSTYNNFVDAVHDTEYYVVDINSKKTIDYFTDFEKVYEIPAEYITAAYAVARNVESDYNESDYWVADVIVIEVVDWKSTWDSTGVLYNNPSQTSGNVKRVETLNTESAEPDVNMELSGGRWDWNPRDNGNWAYRIDEKEFKDDILYADDLELITSNYNANGLYAGYVIRTRDINDRGGYIDVLFPGTKDLDSLTTQADGEIAIKDVDSWDDGISVTNDELFAILSTDGAVGVNTELRSLRVTNNADADRLNEKHRIIWGVDKDGHVAFVIDVDFTTSTKSAPAWLTRKAVATVDANTGLINNEAGLWYSIATEQVAAKGRYTFSDAYNAFRAWQRNEMTADEALRIIRSAKVNATGDNLKDLIEMENTITGGGSGTGTPNTAAGAASALAEALNKASAAKAGTDKDAQKTAYAALLTAMKAYKPYYDGKNGTTTGNADYETVTGGIDSAISALAVGTSFKEVKANIDNKDDTRLTDWLQFVTLTKGQQTAYDKKIAGIKEAVRLYNLADALVTAYDNWLADKSATTKPAKAAEYKKAYDAISTADATKLTGLDKSDAGPSNNAKWTGFNGKEDTATSKSSDYTTAYGAATTVLKADGKITSVDIKSTVTVTNDLPRIEGNLTSGLTLTAAKGQKPANAAVKALLDVECSTGTWDVEAHTDSTPDKYSVLCKGIGYDTDNAGNRAHWHLVTITVVEDTGSDVAAVESIMLDTKEYKVVDGKVTLPYAATYDLDKDKDTYDAGSGNDGYFKAADNGTIGGVNLGSAANAETSATATQANGEETFFVKITPEDGSAAQQVQVKITIEAPAKTDSVAAIKGVPAVDGVFKMTVTSDANSNRIWAGGGEITLANGGTVVGCGLSKDTITSSGFAVPAGSWTLYVEVTPQDGGANIILEVPLVVE